MKNSEFRTPLIQSGVVLVAIVLIISMIPSGDGMGGGGFIGAAVSGFFNLILFLIALTLAVGISIAVLIAIFIGAISLQSPEKASALYQATKVRFSQLLQNAVSTPSTTTDTSDTVIPQEEYDKMKNELMSLQNANQKLQSDVSTLNSKNEKLQEDLHGLTLMVDELKESEAKINELIHTLSAKVEEEPDTDIKDQIHKLEEMYAKTNESITVLAGRIEAIESSSKPAGEALSSGIFTYIESEEDKGLFSDKVQEGVDKELTYAQFDTFLSESLPPELDKIIKDHPSLTKDYIRSMRK